MYDVMREKIREFEGTITDPKLRKLFDNCFYNTLDTTVQMQDDGSAYIITGDIDAMWLRDSSEQVVQYLPFTKEDPDVRALIRALSRRQTFYIAKDPYANAFNRDGKGFGWVHDECEKSPWVWERKFELDSLCFPLWLAYRYWKNCGDAGIFDDAYVKAVGVVLGVFETEQRHNEQSPYFHYRPTEDPSLSVPNRGRGGICPYTGMVWSGYRPSDDPCLYGYFVPGNIMVATVMRQLGEIFTDVRPDGDIVRRAAKLSDEILAGVKKYAVVHHEEFGDMYAYEVDGWGNHFLMDDAGVPGLLSLPYLGFCANTDPVYRNTRRFALSRLNPYYFEGSVLRGVGSPHTERGQVWPIGMIVQGLTSDDPTEINGIVEMLLATDAGTSYIHESINKDDPSNFTRSWFAWANSLFSAFILRKAEAIEKIQKA